MLILTKKLFMSFPLFYVSDTMAQSFDEKCGASFYLEKMLLNEELNQEFIKNRSDSKLEVIQQNLPPSTESLVIPFAVHYNTSITHTDIDCLINVAQA